MYTHIHYHPWIGPNYPSAQIYHKKILLLGESHYGDEYGDSNLTTRCVQHFELEAGDKNRFYRMVPAAMMGYSKAEEMSYEERIEFWNSVVFYNFIQESVNDGPGGKRTQAQWEGGKAPFFEVLFHFEPEIIIAFGTGLGNHIPHDHGVKVNINGLKCVEYTYPSGKKGILAVVRHPAGGMSYDEVHQTLAKLGLGAKLQRSASM